MGRSVFSDHLPVYVAYKENESVVYSKHPKIVAEELNHLILFFFWAKFNSVPHSWGSGFTQQAIAQLIGHPRYLRFNVLIREDAKRLTIY